MILTTEEYQSLIGLYFGQSKIKKIEQGEDDNMFKVYVKDSDNVLEVPRYELFACANKEKLDETWMKRKRCIAVQETVLKLLLDMNVRISDSGDVCGALIKDLQESWNKASEKLFGVTRDELRLKKIDEVLKS